MPSLWEDNFVDNILKIQQRPQNADIVCSSVYSIRISKFKVYCFFSTSKRMGMIGQQSFQELEGSCGWQESIEGI